MITYLTYDPGNRIQISIYNIISCTLECTILYAWLCKIALPFITVNASLVKLESDEAWLAWVTDTPPTDVKVVPTWLRDPDPVKSTL